jgi:hypothetical protein
MAYALNKRNYCAGLMAAKKFAVCDILTGKEYKSVKDYAYDCESIAVMEYGVYLLQEMGLNFGKYQYFMPTESKGGIVSPRLLEDIHRFNKFQLIGEAKDYIINDEACKQDREKITRLIIESRDISDIKYGFIEYLGAMANTHYLKKNRPSQDTLRIVGCYTPFQDYHGNNRALQSSKRLMR